MADGEGEKGKTDGEIMADVVAERDAEIQIQLDIAKRAAVSPEGQAAKQEADALIEATRRADEVLAASTREFREMNEAHHIAEAQKHADAETELAEANLCKRGSRPSSD